MIVQLNLLPDVKEKYIRTQRLKRMIFGGSVVAIALSLTIVGILGSVVYVAQKVKIDSLNDTIAKNTKVINNTEDLDKILTIQNQLNSLTELHDEKAVTSRLIDFLPQITPNDITISNITVAFGEEGSTEISIAGNSTSLESTNKFVDTLKFTKYTTDSSTDQNVAFSSVVLTGFSRSSKESSFKITAKYDTALFSSTSKSIKLIVPKQVTTQSTTQRPTALFKQSEGVTQ